MIKAICHRFLMTVWLCCLVSFLSLAPAILAQLDEGGIAIVQEGNLAGVVWVPERPAMACEYKEVWYLFPSYIYPSLDQPVETLLTVAPEYDYEDEKSFRVAMEEEYPGGHFVMTVAVEERDECM